VGRGGGVVTDTSTTSHADTSDLIRSWRASSKRVEQIAADLALKIDTGQLHRWDELPRQSVLAGDYNVTERTITSVKSLLAVHEFLTLENGRYYVA
jgi:DNA-binding GntR family transcriptional regulator